MCSVVLVFILFLYSYDFIARNYKVVGTLLDENEVFVEKGATTERLREACLHGSSEA